MEVLENYCNKDSFMESRPPLIVVGEPASGKSALLSNWITRRISQDPEELSEVTYEHYTGASYDSIKVIK